MRRWHEGRLGLAVIVPSTQEWTAGDHDYRCALFEFAVEGRSSKLRTGSLRDGLRGARPLALTCLDARGVADGNGWWASVSDVVPIDCAQPHDGELAGLYVGADVAYPGAAAVGDEVMRTCTAKVATFLGRSRAAVEQGADLRVVPGGYPDRWELGDRTSRCYVLAGPDNRRTKSLRR
jgi:hypothetical protein